MTNVIWIVVANQAASRIFETRSSSGEMEEKTAAIHPASRLKEKDLVSDAPGRTYDRFGAGRHRADPVSSQHERETASFANEIASALKEGVTGGEVDTLILVAPPAFLGELRGRLDAKTLQHVTLELGKDLVHLDVHTIRSRLPEFLPRH
ncbi:protein required for attachment to host cells [Paraburkholderia fungorum]|uniref:host attachment protein n=1 Tax=Paraburkholderia fungorum TaxID=134537 RepID=UPI000D4CEF8A|nr:host attachment protein [Paraburkholderia fungorum]PRZ46752.1 protein required for attachment to host cells [Paraburkholderia fungorum]